MAKRSGTSVCMTLAVFGLSLTAAAASTHGPELVLDDLAVFTTELEAALGAPCDPSLFESSVDFRRLVDRGIHDIEIGEAITAQFTEGIRNGFDLAQAICVDVEAGGTYKLLRARDVDGQPRALFRLISADGVNYHDLLLDGKDRLAIIDIFIYSNGEWLSQLARRGFLPLAARLGGDTPGGTDPGESLYLDNVQNILKMVQLYRDGSYEEALDIFNGFPPELKKNRNVLMQRFAIAVKAGGEEYDAAMSDLKTAFPDDPSLGLVLIDYHFNRGEYDKSLELIERLDHEVGGDPYLDFFRANVLYAAGRVREAKRAARKAIEAEPSLEDPYWTLVTISLEHKEFDETAKLLSEIELALGLVVGNLETAPGYSEFVKSEAYTAWLAAHDGSQVH